ncbi:MAG: glycosyltransferase family 39 protein [Myxococcota bacterium]
MKPRIGWRDHLFGASLAIAYVALLMATAGDIAMSRDESFYVIAAQDYAGWFELLWEDPSRAMEPEVRDRAWDYNHEHPGLAKALFALSWIAHQHLDLFESDSMAFRFPGIASAGLLLWLIFIFGARVFGREAGAFAAAAYALMPRPFYHSHLDCFDIPIVLAITFTIYAYWRSLRSRGWAIWTGIAWGLALSVKHNSWVLPGIFLIHFVWMSVGIRAARKRGEQVSTKLSTRPWWMISMTLLGPPIFIATWPWLWSDELLARFGWYARFHVSHVYYDMAYFGESYFQPPFPISYPFVMTLFTVPLVTVVLALLGVGFRLRAMLPEWLVRRWKSETKADAARTDVLLAGSLLAPLLMIALPSSPIFGATKHWFPAYPFLAMYAGFGFWRVIHSFRHGLGARLPQARYTARALATFVLLLPPAIETVHSHPFGLSHYTYAAGGVPGSADYGMNRQFWGFTTGSLVDFFRDELPDGGRVFLCDTTSGAWEMLRRDGLIPANIRGTFDLANADFVMVHLEHHFVEVDYQVWAAWGTTQPAYVLTYDGVPIVNVYENPRRRR